MKLNKSRTKIREVDRLLSEVKAKLKKLRTERNSHSIPKSDEKEILSEKTTQSKPRKKNKTKITTPTSEPDFQAVYEDLYEQFKNKPFEDIREFIKGKKKSYLKSFCKANNLPIYADSASKKMIAEEVLKWMAQRKAMSKKPT